MHKIEFNKSIHQPIVNLLGFYILTHGGTKHKWRAINIVSFSSVKNFDTYFMKYKETIKKNWRGHGHPCPRKRFVTDVSNLTSHPVIKVKKLFSYLSCDSET